jgi:hypothetical protein
MEGATKRAFTLLEIVSRSSTNENEAISAARQLGRMKDAAGGFDKLFAVSPPASIRLPIQSFNESRRSGIVAEQERDEALKKVAKLEAEVSRLTVENAELKESLAGTKAAMKATIRKRSDGTMPFKEFAYKAVQNLGTKSWRQDFCNQTGVDANALARAAASGIAGAELVDLLSGLKRVNKATFSPADVMVLREWAAELSDEEMATRAESPEFKHLFPDRIITAGMIKKLRADLKGGHGLFGATAYGGKLPVPKRQVSARPPIDGRNAPFPWNKYPEIERRVCENYLKRIRVSASIMATEITKETGIQVNEGQIKQRCDNAGPPLVMQREITGVDELTWIELWKLGSDISPRAWKKTAFEILGVESVQAGYPISHIPANKVQKLREAARKARA